MGAHTYVRTIGYHDYVPHQISSPYSLEQFKLAATGEAHFKDFDYVADNDLEDDDEAESFAAPQSLIADAAVILTVHPSYAAILRHPGNCFVATPAIIGQPLDRCVLLRVFRI